MWNHQAHLQWSVQLVLPQLQSHLTLSLPFYSLQHLLHPPSHRRQPPLRSPTKKHIIKRPQIIIPQHAIPPDPQPHVLIPTRPLLIILTKINKHPLLKFPTIIIIMITIIH